MKRILLVFFSAFALTSFADETTLVWTGAAGDGCLASAANWAGGVAPSGDGTEILSFAGSLTETVLENDLPEGTAVAGLSFDGAFTLSGNRLALNGSVTTKTAGATIGTPLTLNEQIEINTGSGLNLSGTLDGPGGIVKTGSGKLTLEATNSTYTGKTEVLGGTLSALHLANLGEASAIGAPTTVENGCINVKRGAIFEIQGTGRATDRAFCSLEGSSGESEIRHAVSGGTDITLNGEVSGVRIGFYMGGAMRNFLLNGPVTADTVIVKQVGYIRLANATNAISTLSAVKGAIMLDSIAPKDEPSSIGNVSDIRLGIYNSMGTSSILSLDDPDGGRMDSMITLVTCTYSKPTTYIVRNTVAGTLVGLDGAIAVANANWPSDFKLDGVGDGEITKVIPSTVRLCKAGTGTWTIASDFETIYPISVEAGTLRLAGTVTVPEGLSVSGGAALGVLGTVSGPVTFAEDATLLAGSEAGALSAIELNGAVNVTLDPSAEFKEGRTYPVLTWESKSGSGYFRYAGEGTNYELIETENGLSVKVNRTSSLALTWKGDDAANRWNTTDANWTDASALYEDGAVVTFDDTGSDTPAIAIDQTVEPGSVVVDATAKHYVFTGAGIGGSATFTKTGTNTVTLSNANTYRGVTTVNGGTLQLVGGSLNNTEIAVGAWSRLVTDENSSIGGNCSISFNNHSNIEEQVQHTFSGRNTFTGTVKIGNEHLGETDWASALYIRHPEALGDTNGWTEIYSHHSSRWTRLGIPVSLTVTNEQLRIDAGHRGGWMYAGINVQNYDVTAGWHGDVIVGYGEKGTSQNLVGRMMVERETSVLTLGSPDRVNALTINKCPFVFSGRGTVNMNSRIASGAEILKEGKGTLNLSSTDNAYSGFFLREGRLVLMNDNALSTNDLFQVGIDNRFKQLTDNNSISSSATLDLNGHMQRLAKYGENLVDSFRINQTTFTMNKFPITITSPLDKPATLIFEPPSSTNLTLGSSSPNGTMYVSVTGAVSFVKRGAGSLTICSANSNVGSLRLEEGTLTAACDKALGALTNITLTAGTLALASNSAIDETAEIVFERGATGMISVDEGVTATVNAVTVNGIRRPSGLYSATGHSGSRVWSLLSGDGLLQIRRGGGMLLVVR